MGKYVFKANTKDTRIVDINNVPTGMCSLAGKPITRNLKLHGPKYFDETKRV